MGSSGQIIDCLHCPLRDRKVFREFTPAELQFVREFKRGERIVQAGETFLSEGEDSPHLFTVLEGWAFRHKGTAEGGRQILNFALSGDLIGLQAAVMGKIDHSVTALTALRLCVFEKADVWKIYRNHPELSFDITWIASREERLLDRNLLSLGQRRGAQRVAYLLAQLADRAAAVSGTDARRIDVPLRQHHLADALGMTKVHVSRMVTQLKKKGLIDWQLQCLDIINWDQLCAYADYEPAEPRRERPFI